MDEYFISRKRTEMPRQTRLLLLLLLFLMLFLDFSSSSSQRRSSGTGRVRKKARRNRSCLDLPEEILEQMFGRLSVGVMSAFHHALQLEPQGKVNMSCPNTGRTMTQTSSRLPVNLLSVSPWAYR